VESSLYLFVFELVEKQITVGLWCCITNIFCFL